MKGYCDAQPQCGGGARESANDVYEWIVLVADAACGNRLLGGEQLPPLLGVPARSS